MALKAQYTSRNLNIAIGVCAAITVAAIVLWGVQLSGGLVQTGMRNLDSWGLYILSFMWFVGLSAGGLIISSVPRVFGMDGFGGISKIAIWTSIAAVCCAIGMVLVDMGNPQKVWELFIYSNLSSPLMWDIIVLLAYLIISIVYLWAYLRHEGGKVTDKAMREISACALVVAILVHTVTAWIIGVQVSHELWHTALMGPWFVCSALVSGTALVLVVCIALRKIGYLELDGAYLQKMAKWLGGFCLVDLYFFGCDLLTSGWNAGAEGIEVVKMLTVGNLAPYFWAQVILTVIAAVICLAPKFRTVPGMVVAGVLAMIAIFCKRFQLVVGGFQIPNVELPGVMSDFAVAGSTGMEPIADVYSGLLYSPTLLEIGILVGMIAMGALIVLLGIKYLDLKPAEASR